MTGLNQFINDRTPVGWTTKPLWSLFRRRKVTGYPEEELLSVYRDYGVIPKSSRDDNFNKESDDLSGYQLVTEGALVTNKMKAWQGSIAISRFRGIVSPAYYVYEPLSDECDQFLHYLLRSDPYIALYGRISKGVRVNQWDLEHEALRNVPVMLPDLETQKQIADFLDCETARIDQLIEKKQRLIELVQERKYSFAERLVTFGLDNGVEKVNTRNPWFPFVAKGTKIMQIKRVAELLNGYAFNSADLGQIGIPVIRIGDVGAEIKIESALKFGGERSRSLEQFLVAKGDILIAMTGATIGKFGVYSSNALAYVNQRVGILRARDIDRRFLSACLGTRTFVEQMKLFAYGGAQPNIGAGEIGSIVIPVPPPHMQKSVATIIQEQNQTLGSIASAIGESIRYLQEYRSALIAEAVTGQLDVAAWSRKGHADRRLDEIQEAMGA